MKKKGILLIIIFLFLSIALGVFLLFVKQKKQYTFKQLYKPLEEFTKDYTISLVTSYKEYIDNKEKMELENLIHSSIHTKEELEEALQRGQEFLLFTITLNPCGEEISMDKTEIEYTKLKVYFSNERSCRTCDQKKVTYLYEVKENLKNIETIEPYLYISNISKCDQNINYKPIIYFYTLEEMDITVSLGNPSFLTHTYPKYNEFWNLHIFPSGTIYDYSTKKNYYALYWEGIDNTKIDTSIGFVVEGKDTISFLEEKLSYLGLNEREINEFIIYWINKLENNPYNYIHFRTTEEMNAYMKLNFSKEPDTLIRILMDYAPLSKKIKVLEQKLIPQKREGFTVIEWGGRKIEKREENYE